jgi:hypothetical protein
MDMQRKQLAIEGVPVLFWAEFWADLYGNTPFPMYLLFHACWRMDYSCLLPTEEAPA